MKRAFTTSRRLLSNPQVSVVLGRKVIKHHILSRLTARLGFVLGFKRGSSDICIGWGRKDNTQKIRHFAQKQNLPFWCLEDGFIGYLSHPVYDETRLGFVIDKSGIYYDSHHPSDLENHITNRTVNFSSADKRRTIRLIERIKHLGLSKYNFSMPYLQSSGQTPLPKDDYVLVIDQTYGDVSVRLGAGTDDDFVIMLKSALAENPAAPVLIKVHPDTRIGKKSGFFDPDSCDLTQEEKTRLIILRQNIPPNILFKKCLKLYTVTSQMGFEGLLYGVPVVTFGCPFYAFWGLTDDRKVGLSSLINRRTARPDLITLTAAVLLDYQVWLDPYAATLSTPERVFDLLEGHTAIPQPVPGTKLYAAGFSLWKKSFVGRFLPKGIILKHKRHLSDTLPDVLVWGADSGFSRHNLCSIEKDIKKKEQKIWRMEDGFLRSVGLGSDLKRPASLVVDGLGIYYDQRQPSALECWFQNSNLSAEALARAKKFKMSLLKSGLSKYNVGAKASLSFKAEAGQKKVILVPGQVESDASIKYGSPEVTTNRALLEQVREKEPNAYIVYKPHPDIVAGNRDGNIFEGIDLADQVVVDVDIMACLKAVDCVHTITSQTGFEALIRGVPVTCYGLPFYAGWGLTTDTIKTDRRSRKLSLEHLIYGAMIAYPRYYDWINRRPTSPEIMLSLIEKKALKKRGNTSKIYFILRLVKKYYFLLEAKVR